MNKLVRPLAWSAALGVAGLLGMGPLTADSPKTPSAPPPTEVATKPAADAPMTPVKITDAKIATKTAVDPKPLSAAVKKGLEYLVKQQQEDGGWNQGGGWRIAID